MPMRAIKRPKPGAAAKRRPAAFRNRLIIMAKMPVLGRVKTRLAGDIGPARATMAYRHMVRAMVGRMRHDRRWQTILAVAPSAAVTSRALPVGVPRRDQGGGDLGRRMQRLLAGPARGHALVIGSDIAGVTPARIAAAFHGLAGADAVFGPARDGGYWLVGRNRLRRAPYLFAAVRWSSPHALADTLANTAGLRVAFAATCSDIDTGADYAAHGSAALRHVP